MKILELDLEVPGMRSVFVRGGRQGDIHSQKGRASKVVFSPKKVSKVPKIFLQWLNSEKNFQRMSGQNPHPTPGAGNPRSSTVCSPSNLRIGTFFTFIPYKIYYIDPYATVS